MALPKRFYWKLELSSKKKKIKVKTEINISSLLFAMIHEEIPTFLALRPAFHFAPKLINKSQIKKSKTILV